LSRTPKRCFLVDDHEAEVLEAHVGMEQPVCRDDDVDRAALDTLDHRLSLASRAEARQRLDAHRPVGEAVPEVREVLLGEQRRRHEHRDLLAGLHHRERGAHRNLGLAEADVAADDAVHRTLALQVGEHLADRLGLIRRFLEGKRVRERLVLELANGDLRSAARLAARVEIEQLRRHVSHLLGRALASLRPLVRAELVQRCVLGRRAGVAADEVQRMHRHVHAVAAEVLEHQELALLARDFERLQSDVTADAVLLVHDRRAGLEILQVAQNRLRIDRRALAPPFLTGACAEELRLRENRDARQRERQTLDVRRHREREGRIAARERFPSGHDLHAKAVCPQHLVEHFAPAR